VMETLVVDNGMEFHSANFENLCFSFGINIQYSPRKQAWFKPGVERLIGSMNKGIAHGNLGTTFANILDKGDYDPVKHAVIKLSTLKEIINIWIVDVHHQGINDELQQQPIKIWRDNITPSQISLPASLKELDVLLASTKKRTLTHKGIQYEHLFYNSRDLQNLRKELGTELNVNIRVIESNLSYIYVIHPVTNEQIQVPSLNPPYTEGLSLWQHKVCRKFAQQHLERKDIEGIAEAKSIIRELILRDLADKKSKTRAKAARFSIIGEKHSSQSDAGDYPLENNEESAEITQKDNYERKKMKIEVSEQQNWSNNLGEL